MQPRSTSSSSGPVVQDGQQPGPSSTGSVPLQTSSTDPKPDPVVPSPLVQNPLVIPIAGSSPVGDLNLRSQTSSSSISQPIGCVNPVQPCGPMTRSQTSCLPKSAPSSMGKSLVIGGHGTLKSSYGALTSKSAAPKSAAQGWTTNPCLPTPSAVSRQGVATTIPTPATGSVSKGCCSGCQSSRLKH